MNRNEPRQPRTLRHGRAHRPARPLQFESLERRDLLSAVPTLIDVNQQTNGSISTSPTEFVEVNGAIYFVSTDPATGIELRKLDGSGGEPKLVKDIFPGIGNSLPKYLTNVNGVLFFVANDGATGIELWKSDGTAAGTQRVQI